MRFLACVCSLSLALISFAKFFQHAPQAHATQSSTVVLYLRLNESQRFKLILPGMPTCGLAWEARLCKDNCTHKECQVALEVAVVSPFVLGAKVLFTDYSCARVIFPPWPQEGRFLLKAQVTLGGRVAENLYLTSQNYSKSTVGVRMPLAEIELQAHHGEEPQHARRRCTLPDLRNLTGYWRDFSTYMPFSCTIPSVHSMPDGVVLRILGDSTTKNWLAVFCKQFNMSLVWKPTDGSDPGRKWYGECTNGRSVVIYTGWWAGLPFSSYLAWRDLKLNFSKNASEVCITTCSVLQGLSKLQPKTVWYVNFGHHTAGASYGWFQNETIRLAQMFQNDSLIVGLTTAVDCTKIPEKFSQDFWLRNNIRGEHLFNRAIQNTFRRAPLLDFWSPTVALSLTGTYPDAVHFPARGAYNLFARMLGLAVAEFLER